MEKIGLNQRDAMAVVRPAITPRTQATTASAPVYVATSRSTALSPAARASRDAWPGMPVGDFFWDMLSAVGASGGGIAPLGASPFLTTAQSGSNELGDGLGAYEALLDPHQSGTRLDGAFHGVPMFGLPTGLEQPIERSTRSRLGNAETQFEAEKESVEQFSITHPLWGFLEVDSHRLGADWDVVVRCEDDGTRARLKDREHEFRALLQRVYGVKLTLDVQSVLTR